MIQKKNCENCRLVLHQYDNQKRFRNEDLDFLKINLEKIKIVGRETYVSLTLYGTMYMYS